MAKKKGKVMQIEGETRNFSQYLNHIVHHVCILLFSFRPFVFVVRKTAKILSSLE